ncbi:hypothetical protein DCS_04218 [Drechmeria coniospora]|uniref:Uncharacterized protein n=1 Tax=Drechmeria coniospora TaxID=98403 RepID=A0A151GJK0_DRECN|nr:hypothetical protein DCS_04218 [Drechmeria coniospora]KYK57211.1 hypothetical protein DCS_04218 [Drechmeria coniospora]
MGSLGPPSPGEFDFVGASWPGQIIATPPIAHRFVKRRVSCPARTGLYARIKAQKSLEEIDNSLPSTDSNRNSRGEDNPNTGTGSNQNIGGEDKTTTSSGAGADNLDNNPEKGGFHTSTDRNRNYGDKDMTTPGYRAGTDKLDSPVKDSPLTSTYYNRKLKMGKGSLYLDRKFSGKDRIATNSGTGADKLHKPEELPLNPVNRPVGVAPKLTKARVMDHFGGVAFNLALMASTCLTTDNRTVKHDEPPSQEQDSPTLWERVKGLRHIPGLMWGSFTKLWSQENIDAFKRSWNDLKEAFSEVPDAVKSSVKDLISVENLDAFVESCNDLSTAVKEIPAAVENGAADLANLENADVLGRSLADFATAISEIPGAVECGLNDLSQAPGDIAIAFQKAPRQLAEAAIAFTAEFDKYVSIPNITYNPTIETN